ncbi:MAG TPA: DUF433 domain-containing protein [Chloroflexia bacterium]|nr:DUF433 domain-containing protein [Chloroflexia bacterium]
MITISANPVPLHVDEHGTVRVAGTRLTLESLLALYQQGKAPEEIVSSFDGITLGDVYAVLGYYLHHRVEVDDYLTAQESAGEAAWREVEAHGPAKANPFRERVLSRRTQSKQKEG